MNSEKQAVQKIRISEADLEQRWVAAMMTGSLEVQAKIEEMLDEITAAREHGYRVEFYEYPDGTIHWEARKKRLGFTPNE